MLSNQITFDDTRPFGSNWQVEPIWDRNLKEHAPWVAPTASPRRESHRPIIKNMPSHERKNMLRGRREEEEKGEDEEEHQSAAELCARPGSAHLGPL